MKHGLKFVGKREGKKREVIYFLLLFLLCLEVMYIIANIYDSAWNNLSVSGTPSLEFITPPQLFPN